MKKILILMLLSITLNAGVVRFTAKHAKHVAKKAAHVTAKAVW